MDKDKATALGELLGRRSETCLLSTDDLQLNRGPGLDDSDSPRIRVPTAVATCPRQGLVAVGFDSGEVQLYWGVSASAERPQVGAGFRISEERPVKFLRTLIGYSPFENEDNEEEISVRPF